MYFAAKEALNNGTVQAAALRTVAQSEKSKHVDVAHANAFSSMMTTLNVTNMNQSMSFYYLATLNTIDHYGGAVEYSKLGMLNTWSRNLCLICAQYATERVEWQTHLITMVTNCDNQAHFIFVCFIYVY